MVELRRSPQDQDDHLQQERAVNHQYEHRLDEQRVAAAGLSGVVDRTRNSVWTNPTGAGSTPIRDLEIEPLFGRVVLEEGDPALGRGFYVGSWFTELDATYVVSWAAGVAQLFFAGVNSDDEAADKVVGRRTFVRKSADITDFVDDVEETATTADPFVLQAARQAQMPVAPTFERPRSTPVRKIQSKKVAHVVPLVPPVDEVSAIPSTPTEIAVVKAEGQHFRAERVLKESLARPRSGQLNSVLATLQPDQYGLVTWPDDAPLIVQGGPGTGKTIVAVHRAAYLVHPWRESSHLETVAVVGPTERFVHHVSEAVHQLESPIPGANGQPGGRPVVRSLLNMLGALSGIPVEDGQVMTEHERLLDTDWRLLRFVRQAVRALQDAGSLKRGGGPRIPRLVNLMARGGPDLRDVFAGNEEFAEWCRGLDSFQDVSGKARFLPFLAACGLALQPLPADRKFDHLVVDEAQDVRPLEWAILSEHLRPGGTMSLFGDMNQRRSDWSHSNWVRLATDLEWTDDEGDFHVEELRAGYRSTKEILEFANQLLPTANRISDAIQTGDIPTVIKVRTTQSLPELVVEEAHDLVLSSGSGIVAIIAWDLGAIESEMFRKGWRRSPGDQDAWFHAGGLSMGLLRPEAARGLEFDGVVVVTDNFPRNLGRSGLLYTSLTRAVRQLVVIHQQSLPQGLKAPKSG